MNTQSDHINELFTALSKAQGELKNADKTSINPHFRSKYAALSEFIDVSREPLSKHNLAVTQTMGKDEQGILSLITTLGHSSGQWIKSVFPLICKDDKNIQSWGSSITYIRRYCFGAILGIAPDDPDDDGEKAIKEAEKPKVANKANSFANSVKDQVAGVSKPVEEQTKTDNIMVENQPSEYITENQWEEIKKLISSCNEKFQETTWAYLEVQEIFTHDKMPLSLYMRIKKGCKDNVVKGDYAISQA